MEFTQFGDPRGQLVVYFHGAPGATEETAIFTKYAKQHHLNIICYDRFSIDTGLKDDDYFQQLADNIQYQLTQSNSTKVDFIGFSIGAFVALEISRYIPDLIGRVHLISAAAPLQNPAYLDQMSGGFIFKMAKRAPLVFKVLTVYQMLLAQFTPHVLVNLLFSTATGQDKSLHKQCQFNNLITPMVKHCFIDNSKGYMRDIRLYVQWQANLECYNSAVQLWHGAEDNWSPVVMASDLHHALPNSQDIEITEGLSHYSCLWDAAPKVCAQLTR